MCDENKRTCLQGGSLLLCVFVRQRRAGDCRIREKNTTALSQELGCDGSRQSGISAAENNIAVGSEKDVGCSSANADLAEAKPWKPKPALKKVLISKNSKNFLQNSLYILVCSA